MQRIYTLELFRGIAAIFIMLGHAGFMLLGGGHFLCSLFFVLSGFVFVLSSKGQYAASNYTSYVIRRSLKFYPLAIFTFVLFLARNLSHGMHIGFDSIPTLFLVQTWYPNAEYMAYNGVSWFLSSLLLLTLVAPLIFNYFTTHKSAIWPAVIGCFILSSCIYPFFDDSSYWTYASPYVRSFQFILGLLMGFIFKEQISKPQSPSSPTFIYTLLEIAAIALCILVCNTPYKYQLINLSCIVAVFIFAFQRGGVSRAIPGKFSCFIGAISFEIYMLHPYIINIVRRFIPNDIVYIAVLTGCIIALAYLFHLVNKYLYQQICLYLERRYKI